MGTSNVETYCAIAAWPTFDTDREKVPFTKHPGVPFHEPVTLLDYIEMKEKQKRNVVLKVFGPKGALAICAEKKVKVTLQHVSAIFVKACRNHPQDVVDAHTNFDEKARELYVYLYRNSDYSLKPNCELDKQGKAVSRLSYQPLQVALLLKLTSMLQGLATESQVTVLDIVRQIGTITPENALHELQEMKMWARWGLQ